MISFVLGLSRNNKRLFFVISDTIFLTFCCYLSFALRYGEITANNFLHWPAYILAPIVSIPVFVRLGLYRAVVRYIGNKALWAVVKSVSLAVLIWATAVHLMGLPISVPRSVIFIYWFVAIVAVGGSRMFARWLILHKLPGGEQRKLLAKPVVIYGAGASGRQLVDALYHADEFLPVAFIDDNKALQGLDVSGVRVHPVNHLSEIIERFEVDTVLLAINSIGRLRKKGIIKLLEPYAVNVMTIPGMSDIASGKVRISDIRRIEINDILGRREVSPDSSLLKADINKQNVIVTGAGGSIGSELSRQIIVQKPNLLILFEQSEYALYKIESELRGKCSELGIRLIAVLGSVLDKALMSKIVKLYSVDTFYHAAAYKHVPIVELNMVAGIRNNIFGTYATAEVAIKHNVKSFVLISTDKAVRPTNVMGASKRFAELTLQALSSQQENTRFAIVRFGNVLGSSGSVIPLFESQIASGGPVTVTHPDITRYFMTIPEAASLVIQAGAMGNSGDVFVLDMGSPVKIVELAQQMIKLAGYSIKSENQPGGDIEILFTGLRDGEKLYEELLIGDNVSGTSHPMILKADEVMINYHDLLFILEKLDESCSKYDHETIRETLLRHVNGYQPQCGIKDNLYQ
ncbi:polysaccharide biosynthesis protein [Neptuniibacter sp. QD48_11]|uniref:polysaccharide biosynthesis protein n=1 Tax=unclassified Neptuniibacter TaxID=2630693 RepID=UPI0039F59716